MSAFPNKQFNGTTYTFEHLQPMAITLELRVDGQLEPHQLAVEVTFGCHCFTETFDPRVHEDHHRYTHDGELRAFDIQRYECSLQLPQVIKSLTSGMIYRSDEYFTYVAQIKVSTESGPVSYTLIFSLIRATKNKTDPASRLLMYVKTAYLAPLRARSKTAQHWRFKGLVVDIAGL